MLPVGGSDYCCDGIAMNEREANFTGSGDPTAYYYNPFPYCSSLSRVRNEKAKATHHKSNGNSF